MKKYGLLAIALTVLIVGWGIASDCRFRGVGATYVAPTHSYGAYYYPPVTIGSAGVDQTELVAKIFAAYQREVEAGKIKAAEQEKLLKALIASGGSLPPTFSKVFAPPHPGLEVLVNRCASCHDVSTKASGKGYAFLNGGAFLDEGDNMRKVLAAILPDRATGKAMMPPPSRKPLSGDEGFAATGFLVTLPDPSKVEAVAPKLPPK